MTDDAASELDEALATLPPSVDRAAVERMHAVAELLDASIRVPGTRYRIGLDPLIGLLPVGGDALAGGVSLYIVAESARQGVSRSTLVRMLANVAIDVGVGSVPYVGDVFDAVWKANRRNLRLAVADLAEDGSPGRQIESGEGDADAAAGDQNRA